MNRSNNLSQHFRIFKKSNSAVKIRVSLLFNITKIEFWLENSFVMCNFCLSRAVDYYLVHLYRWQCYLKQNTGHVLSRWSFKANLFLCVLIIEIHELVIFNGMFNIAFFGTPTFIDYFNFRKKVFLIFNKCLVCKQRLFHLFLCHVVLSRMIFSCLW